MKNLAYPVGHFEIPAAYQPDLVAAAIQTISDLPAALDNVLTQLSTEQLDQAYRPGGWTVRQVVHHFSDSHINAFARCKMATTEDWPQVKPYAEAAWAEQADHQLPLASSLGIIKGIHERWTVLCRSLSVEDWQNKGYTHPEYGRRVPLWEVIPMYAWHCRHHLGHIELVRG